MYRHVYTCAWKYVCMCMWANTHIISSEECANGWEGEAVSLTYIQGRKQLHTCSMLWDEACVRTVCVGKLLYYGEQVWHLYFPWTSIIYYTPPSFLTSEKYHTEQTFILEPKSSVLFLGFRHLKIGLILLMTWIIDKPVKTCEECNITQA